MKMSLSVVKVLLSPLSAAVKQIITVINTLLGAITHHTLSPHAVSQQLYRGINAPGKGGGSWSHAVKGLIMV